jgi:sulfur carrier protein
MQIILNGEVQSFSSSYSVADLLVHLSLSEQRLAVEINLEVIPRSDFANRQLQADDKVEIVRAIGGG